MEQTTMLDRKTTYNDLPVEIISYIFSYLSYTDCLQAGSTCKLWRDVFFENNHKRTGKVHFIRKCLSDCTSPGSYLLKSHRSYRTFHFRDVRFGYAAELIRHIAKTAVNVIFDTHIEIQEFRLFMRHAKNLESLTIKSWYIIDRLVMDYDIEEELYNNQLYDPTLQRITSSIRILETLHLSNCEIAYSNAIKNVPPNDRFLKFALIANVFKTHHKHFKELKLGYTGFNNTELQLAPNEEEQDCIKLYSLKLPPCWELDTTGMTSFLKTQPQLVVLHLSGKNYVNDDFLETLVETLSMIEDLNISRCRSVTNEGCAHLGTLKRLKRLNISHCDKISSDGLKRGIARTVNSQLHHLQIAGLNICEEGIKCIALNCLELRTLDVSDVITDTSLKYILQHLRWLRDLSLIDCWHISDAGLTGINIPPYRIPLLIEKFINDINPTNNRVSIESLKGLRRLNLAGCEFTDATLIHSIKFAELTDLNLSSCRRISSRGIQSVPLNCPSIERLDLSGCKINDEDVHFLIKNLSRLKYLCVDTCSKLTKNARGAVYKLTRR